jgi:hypothetical protein|tara:strand:- start:1625 stop:1822 length:198 start_codon:yes stop_codon:yes gene_type:complete
MATSDELLAGIQNLAIDYARTPKDDQFEDGANFHFQLIDILERIHNQMVIANEMYRVKNAIEFNS